MKDGVAINTIFPPDLLERIEDYGSVVMAATFNSDTKRGRSAVVRQLVAAGLRAERSRLETARRQRKGSK